jgi:hypothetical protein
MNFTGKIRVFAICCVALLACAPAVAQQASSPDPFAAYVNCGVPNGPQIIEVTPRAPGASTRPVRTLTGTAAVNIDDGRRIRFGYSEQEPYANVDIESIPAAAYAKSKAALTDNFEFVLASGDSVRNYKLKPRLNGFEIQGLDRTKREGETLGMYLLFDNPTRTALTIYFLNQQQPTHSQNMQQYAAQRDQFLQSYTSCVRKGLEPIH